MILVLAESALETIPKALWSHPAIRSHSKRRGKPPRHIILDRTYDHPAMKNLAKSWKRGRPDIVHFALLQALGSPLNKEGLLQVYVHTFNNHVVTVNPEARLPRNYNRFVSLLEQLFEQGRVPSRGQVLVELGVKTLSQILEKADTNYVMAFSREGSLQTIERTICKSLEKTRPAAIVGGFPHGHFSETTLRLADEVVCVDREMLETWTLTSRVIYEYERAISLPEKRLKK